MHLLTRQPKLKLIFHFVMGFSNEKTNHLATTFSQVILEFAKIREIPTVETNAYSNSRLKFDHCCVPLEKLEKPGLHSIAASTSRQELTPLDFSSSSKCK